MAEVDTDFLQAFADAWTGHDLDALMSFMADECVFELSVGPDRWGNRYEGRDQVREGFASVLETFPDGRWDGASHFVAGDRGVSEWVFTATAQDGSAIEVNGCDLFTFQDGKIAVKNSFRKVRTAP
jgi:steroid delta-isomerase-like uncharacterized protein